MKLYTEKQVVYAIRIAFDIEPPIKVRDILRELTPIEIPNDEEIQDESEKHYDNNAAKAHDYYFELGAKWMRDIIQGGSHE